MPDRRFPFDENVDPATVEQLDAAAVGAEHVRDALGKGADDREDVLPYARETGRIVVTSGVTDFAGLPADAYVGLALPYDEAMPAHRIVAALTATIEAYDGRDSFRGREVLDDWA
jgi:hypothetical protein